ncbi:MAG TPA: TatD family hydrolase, partial [Prolixibacteraceae bacterium]|nr:TatD family hydrolase [Prolixibacteraceae bacterium]
QLSSGSNMVAFGETGLDKACEIPLQVQLDVFELHLEKAVEHNKSIIIHCVKAWDEIIEISSRFPAIKILHGYNGSDELTGRLLKQGFYFSVGSAILNPRSKIRHSIATIPATLLFCETDTSQVSVKSIYAGVSEALKMEEEALKSILFHNFQQLIKVQDSYPGSL